MSTRRWTHRARSQAAWGDHRVEMRGQIRNHPSTGAVVTGVRAHIEQRDNFPGRFAENAGADERVDQTG